MSSIATKKQRVVTKKQEEFNKSAKIKEVMLRQGFSAGCQHKEEFVMTKKLLSQQMKQAESRNSVATRDLLSRH